MAEWWDEPFRPSLDVPEHKPVETGLLDRRGKPIMRPPPQVGFHKPKKERHDGRI